MKRNSTEHDVVAEPEERKRRRLLNTATELTRQSIPHTLRRHCQFHLNSAAITGQNVQALQAEAENSLVIVRTKSPRVDLDPLIISYDTLVFPGDIVQHISKPGHADWFGNHRISFITTLSPATPATITNLQPIQLIAWSKPKGMVIDNTPGQPFAAVVNEIKSAHQMSAIHPIGQLDKQTTGLFLFSNDGDCSNYINLPGNIEKKYVITYHAPRGREPTAAQIKMLCEDGVDVTRKRKNAKTTIVKCKSIKLLFCAPLGRQSQQQPSRLQSTTSESESALPVQQKFQYDLELVISSGANHIVKRLMAAASFPPVKELRRVAIGEVEIDVVMGAKNFCELTVDQISKLCTEKDIVRLKLCQLLCRYRTSEKHDQQLELFLKNNFRMDDRPCFDEFECLSCRSNAHHVR
jgi:pseudouridine synthase